MSQHSFDEELHISTYIVVYKFILGLSELFLGIGILIFGKQILVVYERFRNQELLEDPHDLLVNILEKFVPYVAAHLGFLVFVLIILGVVKIVGSIGLYYKKHWGLDLLVILTIILLPFELLNLFKHFSMSNIIFFSVNLLIAFYLVNFQPHQYYKNLKKRYPKII